MDSSSRPSRADRRLRGLVAVAALGLVSACGNGAAPGIHVDQQQTDVKFGLPSPTPAQPTSSGFVPQGPGVGFPTGPSVPPLTFPSNEPTFPSDIPSATGNPLCPGPPLGSTAPTAATTSVQGQPTAGFHFWQLIKEETLASKIKVRTPKYTNYEIRNVSPITTTPNPQGQPTTTFTYDQVALGAKGTTLTTTYQLKQNAPGANVGQVSNVGTARRVSEPDAGVAIKAEVLRDAAGKVLGSFQPLTPVLILPLPIVGGASFSGAGVDPTNGSSMQVQGQVKGVDRVASCNSFIQGYRVDATVTSSGAQDQAGPTVAQTYVVETQAGGLVIGNTQTATGGTVTLSSIIGDNFASPKPRDIPKAYQP